MRSGITFLTQNQLVFLVGTPLVPLMVYFGLPFAMGKPRQAIAGMALPSRICRSRDGNSDLPDFAASLRPRSGIFDSRTLAYVQAWNVHSLKHPWRLFEANIFFPAHNTLAYPENLLGNLPVFAPFYLASNNSILGYNVVTLTMFFVLTMYWLAKRIRGTVWAARWPHSFMPSFRRRFFSWKS
jgi:hypothetical protein